MLTLSRAERVAGIGSAIVLALLLAPGAGAALEFRRSLIAVEPWRLVTAHLVHVNAAHAVVNAIAWCALARLFAPDLAARRQALALALGGVAVGVGLLVFYPGIAWYRGLSGALHALFFAGATVRLGSALRHYGRRAPWLPLLLLTGGWIKVWLERPYDAATPYAAWLGIATVPQAHLIGALCGTGLGLFWAARDRRGVRRAGAV